jgi:putative acetyltransferase
MGLELILASGPTDEVRQLIGELNNELGALYSAEQQHGLALDGIFRPHIRFYLAVRDGQAVGCGGVALFCGFAEVKRMYVRPRWRGQGVAEAIMIRLVEDAGAAGLKVLRLETGNRSLAAIGFYHRSGFRSCPVFEPYASMPPHTIETSVFLERSLAP